MKLVLKPARIDQDVATAAAGPMTKAEIPALVEHLLKAFADRLPPPRQSR